MVWSLHFPDSVRHYPEVILPLRTDKRQQLMSDFEINKGVGREVEFKGLRAQYLFIFAFGLLAVFVVFVIMYTAGIGQWTCIGFGVSAATAVVWLTFSLNRRFGSHGLMKLLAARQHPRRILSRKRITRLIKKQQS